VTQPPPGRLRRPVLVALLGATIWLGVVLLAWQGYGWPYRAAAVPIALAPFVAIALWAPRNPPPPG
jgi:hypothetical protein